MLQTSVSDLALKIMGTVKTVQMPYTEYQSLSTCFVKSPTPGANLAEQLEHGAQGANFGQAGTPRTATGEISNLVNNTSDMPGLGQDPDHRRPGLERQDRQPAKGQQEAHPKKQTVSLAAGWCLAQNDFSTSFTASKHFIDEGATSSPQS